MKPPAYTFTVAPLTVLPFQKALFTYGFETDLAPGTIVTVPLSGRTVEGIVLASARVKSTHKPDWLKNILTVAKRPPLTPEQISLAEAVSELAFTPIGKVLKHFVPKQAKARKLLAHRPTHTKLSPLPKNPAAEAVLTTLKKEDSVFLPFASRTEDALTLAALAKKLLGPKKQLLILTPDINSAVRVEKALETYFSPATLAGLYHTKTAGQYFEDWQRVQRGEAQISIATRQGMFAPFKNLSAIIQLDPNDEAYKQWDMSPRYHTQFVLPILQKLWSAKLIQVGPLPPFSVLQAKTPVLPLTPAPITPEWINLKIERYQKNWGPFSAALQTAIKEALAENRQVLLYIHQGGLESFSVCTECRTIFRCPSCQSALKLTSSDHYHCKHCGFKSALFPRCPQCKNIHFKSVGIGSEKVAKEAKKLFPGATIAITDKSHLENHRKVASFLQQTQKNEPDILVVTASFLRFPLLSRLSLTAIIDADTLLNLPGYRKDEQFIELVERLKALLEPKGRLLVQTFRPEADLFQKISQSRTADLLTQLLEERAVLHYPPYYRALTLEARPKKKDAGQALKTTSKKLRSLITSHPQKKELFIQSATRKVRGQDVAYTLLRYRPPLAPDITQFLTKEADHVFIDHDPLHIT